MKIALDVESVLAEPNEAVLASTDQLTRHEVENTWFSRTGGTPFQIYMGVSDAIWRHNPEVIPPEEPNLAQYVDEMREDHEVHILTGRNHVDEQVLWWLDEHNIGYESFTSTEKPKWEYEQFDVFIDDNPTMVGECRLFLRHQPWNAHIDASLSKSCTRIHSLGDVLDFL